MFNFPKQFNEPINEPLLEITEESNVSVKKLFNLVLERLKLTRHSPYGYSFLNSNSVMLILKNNSGTNNLFTSIVILIDTDSITLDHNQMRYFQASVDLPEDMIRIDEL